MSFWPALRNKGSWVGWSGFDWPWDPLAFLDSHVRRAQIRPAHWGSKLGKNALEKFSFLMMTTDKNLVSDRQEAICKISEVGRPLPSHYALRNSLECLKRRMRHAKGEREKKKKWSTSVLKVSRFITTEQWTLEKTSLALFWMSCNVAWPPKERKLTRHKQRFDWLLIQRQHGASANFFFSLSFRSVIN